MANRSISRASAAAAIATSVLTGALHAQALPIPEIPPRDREPTASERADETSTPAPGTLEIDPDAADRALERSLVQARALLLPAWSFELALELSYRTTVSREPAIIEVQDASTGEPVGAVGTLSSTVRRHEAALDLRLGLPGDAQLGLVFPARHDSLRAGADAGGLRFAEQRNDGTGFDDPTVSLAKTLATEHGLLPDLIGVLSFDTDTGTREDGGFVFGSGATEWHIGLSATKRQDPMVFTAGVSRSLPGRRQGVRAAPRTNVSVAAYLAASPRTSLKVAWAETLVGRGDDGDALASDGASLGTLTLGIASIVRRDTFVSVDLDLVSGGQGDDHRIGIALSRRFDR